MKRILSKTILTAIVGVFLLGCYPAGPEYVEDLDIVYTTYSEEYDFNGQSTYSMPDKIVTDVKIENGDTTFVYMADLYAKQLLTAIESNMNKYGWQKVNIDNNPDVLITPGAIKNTTYMYSYWYDWWYGGYYGGWGWYYPPSYSVSSYTTGTLIITIADPNLENPINQSEAAWVAVCNGLLGSDDLNRAIEGIDKAFSQSPYLKTN